MDFSPMLIGLGLAAGIISGFMGVGGGWLITPALISLGFPGIVSVGSSLAYTFGGGIIGTLAHRRLGNVDFKIGAPLLFGIPLGIECGKRINESVAEAAGTAGSDLFISILLIGFLSYLSVFMIKKSYEKKRVSKAKKLQTIRIPPLISSPATEIMTSLWIVLMVAFVVGLMGGLLGVGGGFLLLPALIYLMGYPTKIAIGTSLLGVAVSGAYGSFTYSAGGHIELSVPFMLLISAAVGVQIGAIATRYIRGVLIRRFFGVAVGLTALSRVLETPIYLDQLGRLAISSRLQNILSVSSVFIIYGIIISFAIGIIVLALRKRK